MQIVYLFINNDFYFVIGLIFFNYFGAVPLEIIKGREGVLLLGLWAAAILMWIITAAVFYYGLRRCESGSAINVNV